MAANRMEITRLIVLAKLPLSTRPVKGGCPMTTRLVFIPISAGLAMLKDGTLQAFVPDPDEPQEDAEGLSLQLASVWGLSNFGVRRVIVAEVSPKQVAAGEESHNGGVAVTDLRQSQITSFFTTITADAADTAEAVRGLDIDQAWDLPPVQAMLAEGELLWHGAEELLTEESLAEGEN